MRGAHAKTHSPADQTDPKPQLNGVMLHAFYELRRLVLLRELLSGSTEQALWLCAFTGELHVQVHSGIVGACSFTERSPAQFPSAEELALRKSFDPGALKQANP